jgi:hypothetical protein
MSKHVEIKVHEVCQTSGLDFVVIFDASMDLIQGQDEVEILSVSVRAGDDSLAERAANSIKRGILAVLRPLGLGATVRISSLVLHPVDFSEKKFERFTAEYLTRAIGENR